MKSKIWWSILVFLYASAAAWPSKSLAADLDVADTPLFAAVSIDPNIMFTLDDSGSMQWEYMPDDPVRFRFTIFMFPRPGALYGGTNYANQVPSFRDNSLHNFFGRSAANNGVFYNPDITYRPWALADGSSMPDANPTNALYNPDRPFLGGLNLRAQQTQVATWFRGDDFDEGICDPCGGNHTYWPITYYNYNGGSRTNRASYTRVQITTATPAGATFTSPGGITRTRDEEIQNFANWFQYSRSRLLSARNGIGRAFTELSEQARVGFAAINQGNSTVDGVNTNTIIDGVRPFAGGFRENFYDRLYGRVINNFGTPLRRAAEDVGQYFGRTDARGPWSTTPGLNSGADLACRQSYHILMTDGFWNGANPAVGNSDNAAGPTHTSPDGDTGGYTPTDPYRDSNTNTLADVAMDFWKRDLRTDIDNRVPTNEVDTAFWQHLTTFGIGLGVTGNLDPDDVFQAVEDGTAIDWGNPFANNPDKIDDLLHFGINGRGGFFSAADPDTFAAQLGEILRDIVARSGATTGLSASSTRLNAGSVVYTAGFDSEDWSGDLRALDVITGNQLESAADRLAALGHTGRTIATWDPVDESGAAFAPSANLTPRVMADAPNTWSAIELFDYLSGDLTAGAGVFRVRDSMLGDIVGSQPVFSGPGNEGWGEEDPDYFTYIDTTKRDPRDPCESTPCPGSRRNTVFVGANDGMLHAFDAVTLEEYFAYVPAAVHENLHQLADPDYAHRYFVDGQQAVADAKIGSGWGTYLVGSLGAGGRGIYALDITAPQSFDPLNDVLWEFTAEDDPDVGLTYGRPAIGKIRGGPWIAAFGNGYNSEDNQAYLYVLNLNDGSLLAKVPVGDDGSNGLSGVALVPEAGDPLHVRYIYAGDIEGNMWRFDVDSGGVTASFGGDPLFTDPDGRPIIAAPNVALHPVDGNMVFFGTGKLIENADRLNSTVLERFYAVRDRDTPVTSIGDLDEVQVTAGTGSERGFTPTGPAVNGWYAGLAVGTPNGERVLFTPQLFAGRVVFGTYEPANDPCTPGGIQRAYVLSALSGSGQFPGSSSNTGGVIVGEGAALAPVIGIKDAPTPTGTPGSDPGVTTPDPGCDPSDPGCTPPTDPTSPPGVAGGVRDNWCRQIGLLSTLPNGSPVFQVIGTMCEGRQAWRQVR
jgi:type IV pilus assembly protein PilY1